jgi:hypothetical protein
MVSESQTEKPAPPPQKQLKLGPLKGWGIQRDGVSMSTATTLWWIQRGVSGVH